MGKEAITQRAWTCTPRSHTAALTGASVRWSQTHTHTRPHLSYSKSPWIPFKPVAGLPGCALDAQRPGPPHRQQH